MTRQYDGYDDSTRQAQQTVFNAPSPQYSLDHLRSLLLSAEYGLATGLESYDHGHILDTHLMNWNARP